MYASWISLDMARVDVKVRRGGRTRGAWVVDARDARRAADLADDCNIVRIGRDLIEIGGTGTDI